MHYFKRLAKDNIELKPHLNSVNCFSDVIRIDFWLNKCEKVTLNEERIAETHLVDLDLYINIRNW